MGVGKDNGFCEDFNPQISLSAHYFNLHTIIMYLTQNAMINGDFLGQTQIKKDMGYNVLLPDFHQVENLIRSQ